MNVSFLIGNGFDLNLGLKTRYLDFYDFFIKNCTDNNIIKCWIENDNNIKLWSDLEARLGEKASELNIDDVDRFIQDKEETELLLSSYISEQQNEITKEIIDRIFPQFFDSLLYFYKSFNEDDSNKVNSMLNSHNQENINYRIIDFNYSNIIDRIFVVNNKIPFSKKVVNSTSYGYFASELLHIHGYTNKEMILGVNDESQINNPLLLENSVFLDSFIKERMNLVIGQNKTIKANKIINSSDIIVIFGLAQGITDKKWWSSIFSWCQKNPSALLIVYVYVDGDDKNKIIRMHPSTIARRKQVFYKSITEKEFIKEEELNKIKDRMIICFQDTLFHFNLK